MTSTLETETYTPNKEQLNATTSWLYNLGLNKANAESTTLDVSDLVKFYYEKGLITVDEARALIGLSPVPNGRGQVNYVRKSLEQFWGAAPLN